MASSKVRWLRRIALVLAAVLFVVLAWVFPAIYHNRYEPETTSSDPAAATSAAADAAASDTASPVAAADPAAWHPIPTPEQDSTYQQETRVNAAHPGLAVEGKDGYLFLGDDYQVNFQQAMGRRFYSQQEVQLTVDEVQSRNAWLATQGIAGEFVVVPATWSVYTDKMPDWTNGQVLPHILDQLIAADPTSFVDLRPDLVAQRATADTYSRLNSHWTPFGAFVGFQTIVRQLEAQHPGIGPLPVPQLAGTTTVDANNEFAGITGAAGPNNWVVPQFTTPLPPFTVIATDGTRSTVPGDTLLDMTQMPLQTENPAAGNAHRALILADSATSVMSPYLAGAFGSTMMVRHFADAPEQAPNIPALVASYRPDVVITLVSERNLNIVTQDSQQWQAAAAYDTGNPQAIGVWPDDGSGSPITVSQADLATPIAAVLPAVPAGAVGLRLDIEAGDAGTLSVGGTTSAGPVTRSLRVAKGPNILFAQLPAGLVDPTLTITRTAGQETWTANTVTARALP